MKQGGKGAHAFGEANWWGEELFGIDNALVGNWPVVQIQNGKAVIVEFKSIPEWWGEHSATHDQALRSDGRNVVPARLITFPAGPRGTAARNTGTGLVPGPVSSFRTFR